MVFMCIVRLCVCWWFVASLCMLQFGATMYCVMLYVSVLYVVCGCVLNALCCVVWSCKVLYVTVLCNVL